MDENCGIYVVKNDDRKEIKIGWSANIQKNIIQLNNERACFSPYKLYHVYMTDSRDKHIDKKLHKLIDLLSNKRKVPNKEFYKLSPAEAGEILSLISKITKTENRYIDKTRIEAIERTRRVNRAFEKLNIPLGAELVLIRDKGVKCYVANRKNLVEYKGQNYSISKLVQKVLKYKRQPDGWLYFKYKGKYIADLT